MFIRDAHIKIIIAESQNKALMKGAFGGIKFDVIVDDGKHTRNGILQTFNTFFPMLAKGGIYIVEDYGVNMPYPAEFEQHVLRRFPDKSGYECLLVIQRK